MFKVLVKQHCDANTPFSAGYKLENNDGVFNTFLIDECPDLYEAQMTIAKILKFKFDSHYDYDNGCEIVNDEIVFRNEDRECLINGMYIYIIDVREKEKTKWTTLSSPLDSDIKLKVSESEDVLNVQDGVNNHYLQKLTLFYLYNFVMNKSLIGRKVFWLDPCAFRGCEHTSDWKTITDIEDGIITLDDDTEVYVCECYM